MFSTIKRNNISDNKITVFVHDARSFSKYTDDIVSDARIINDKVIGYTETQINPSKDSTSKIMETLSFLNISFNKNESF